MADLSPEQLETLRKIPSCAIANAIETFDVRPRNEGFMSPMVRCIYPDMGHMIGYAVTVVISANQPATPRTSMGRVEYYDELLKIPGPRVVVVQDLDYPNPIGSFWGEVNANVHKALGCVGTVTDGGVRDLDEMQDLGFLAFASEVLVSHAYVHIVDAGVPVNVGGLLVTPGDIIMGDQHGVLNIPPAIAAELPAAVKEVEIREQLTIGLCKSPDFTVEKLKALVRGQ